MNRFVLCLCLALAVVAGLVAPTLATQGTVNGVLVEERVVNLPQDQNKWYISVVGDANEARYQQVLGWFDTNENLKQLKDQVHFCRVKYGTAIFNERYAPNIKGLPTVRVQDSQGVVIYEASANNLPMTPEALYTAIANNVQTAQGCRPLLPWRREMERRTRPCPGPGPCPTPNPQPDPDTDPAPQPITPDPGPPNLQPSPVQSLLPPWWAMLLAVIAGGAVGVGIKWRETYQEK